MSRIKKTRRRNARTSGLAAERLEPRAMLAMQEFLVNGGADLPLVNGEIPGWREIRGSSWTRGREVTPHAGTGHFFAGRVASAELAQSVDVSSYASEVDQGAQRMEFSGFIRSWNQGPSDTSRIVLEYRNRGGTVLGSFDTGNVFHRFAWSPITHTTRLPVGTRLINVRLLSERKSGHDNDGYFDSLSLKLDRPVLTAAARLQGRVLVIDGDSRPNDAKVERIGSQIRVTIRSTPTGTSANTSGAMIERSFDAAAVSSIQFIGRGGNDRFVNTFAIPATAYGGPGDDYLEGTSAVDTFYGDEGNDTLVGHAGDDALHGMGGNDVLRGDSGTDRLYGGEGDDSLYGGAGADQLLGENGDDGLFGGLGDADRLTGGAGDDRFLMTLTTIREKYYANDRDKLLGHRSYRTVTRQEDIITDKSSGDSITQFVNLGKTTRTSLVAFGVVTFSAGVWSDRDIEAVDGGLRNLHQLTGNTRLLKTSTGKDLVFQRAGKQISGGGNIGGWNSGDGSIAFTNVGLHDAANARLTTYHEIAHNWDSAHENGSVKSFRELSGWRETGGTGFTRGGDGSNWHYRNGTSFARDYGRFNPFEDFATTWESYFDRRYHDNQSQLTYVAAKHNALTAFFATLA